MVDTIIVSGGNIQKDFALDFLKEKMSLKKEKRPYLVAADRGLDYLRQIGYEPDIAIGDFDSLSLSGRKYLGEMAAWGEKEAAVVKLRPEKDDTDTQAALNLCIGQGAKNILILGATGTRMDHFFANIGLLAYGKSKDIHIALMDQNNYMCLIESGTVLRKNAQFGKFVSFFPLGGEVCGLTLKGFKYPLEGHCLRISDSGLTVSNEILEEEALVEYSKGMLLMIMSKD